MKHRRRNRYSQKDMETEGKEILPYCTTREIAVQKNNSVWFIYFFSHVGDNSPCISELLKSRLRNLNLLSLLVFSHQLTSRPTEIDLTINVSEMFVYRQKNILLIYSSPQGHVETLLLNINSIEMSVIHPLTLSSLNARFLTRSFATADFKRSLRRMGIMWRHAFVVVRTLHLLL